MTSTVSPGFDQALIGMTLDRLDRDPAVIYGLWADLTFAYFNPAWFRFAARNGGEPAVSRRWPLGTSVMDVVPDALKPFYRDMYARCLQGRGAPGHQLHPAVHEYDCSSPDQYRRFAMTLYGLDAGRGLVVLNSLLVERPHDAGVRSPADADYRDPNGFYHQCSHCRRYQNFSEADRWDWVPDWVRRQPPGTSHGLCLVCFNYYYPGAGGDDDD